MIVNLNYHHTKCLKMAKEHNLPLYKVEQDVFGTTDTFVASKIMETWNLPANICAGVAFYQMPESAPAQYQEIAGLTQLAYSIAAKSEIGSSGDGIIEEPSSTYICQQPNLKLHKKDTQEKLIQEIYMNT